MADKTFFSKPVYHFFILCVYNKMLEKMIKFLCILFLGESYYFYNEIDEIFNDIEYDKIEREKRIINNLILDK